jgi:hypothetical protein
MSAIELALGRNCPYGTVPESVTLLITGGLVSIGAYPAHRHGPHTPGIPAQLTKVTQQYRPTFGEPESHRGDHVRWPGGAANGDKNWETRPARSHPHSLRTRRGPALIELNHLSPSHSLRPLSSGRWT